MTARSWKDLAQVAAPTWERLGRVPLPRLAPSFRLLAPEPPRIWACGYAADRWRSDPLDERWVVDTVDLPATRLVRPGHAIVWIGDTSDAGWCLWPPALVVEVTDSPDGATTRVTVLRDSWLELLGVEDAPRRPDDPSWTDVDSTLIPRALTREVLQWWGLDVWCPACGDLGQPTTGGMTPPPTLRPEGDVDDWREQHQGIGSCVDLPHFDMACPRCGCQWGHPPVTEGAYWPDDPTAETDLAPNSCVEDLVDRYGGGSVRDLEEAIVANDEPDTYAHVREHEVEIQVLNRGTVLTFPMTIRDINTVIDDLENEFYGTDLDNADGE